MRDPHTRVSGLTMRDGLMMLLQLTADRMLETDAPLELRQSLKGSIRHRANKAQRCEAPELLLIGAALMAWSEVLVVFDPSAARKLQAAAECCHSLHDSETHEGAI